MKPKTHSAAKTIIVRGQPSWRLASDTVEAWVTQQGGHLGPVTFDRCGRKIQPFSVAPWAEEKAQPKLIPLLGSLRGDFFCLPFGGNDRPFRGRKYPPHGETANAPWKFFSANTDGSVHSLHLRQTWKDRPGQVDKRITLRDGENHLYCQDEVSGLSGPMDLGHHAMLCFPDEPGSGLISTSPFVYAQVCPQPFETPENKGYQALKTGAEFERLDHVPTLAGDWTDLSLYPARRGFEDLVMLVGDDRLPFAWTAVVFPQQQFVWYALRNPRILRSTIFWISNGGRHYPPWNGRHVNVLGLEDVTAYFHFGLADSAKPNPISRRGYPTVLTLDKKKPLIVPYLMGVAPIPKNFGRVRQIEAGDDLNSIVIQSTSGKSLKIKAAMADLVEDAKGRLDIIDPLHVVTIRPGTRRKPHNTAA